jgi:hypothetical protein
LKESFELSVYRVGNNGWRISLGICRKSLKADKSRQLSGFNG